MKIVTALGAPVMLAAVAANPALAAESPGYLQIDKTEVEVKGKGDERTLEMKIKTKAPIPTQGQSGAFGYAALTDGTNNVLVLVTHLPIDDSSYEQPGSGFHAHVLDLKQPSAACDGANFEVDVDNSKKNTAFDANYRWEIEGTEVEVEGVPIADLGDAGVETIASFTLKPILGEDNQPTNLCITISDQS
jgi:hypothetical protein